MGVGFICFYLIRGANSIFNHAAAQLEGPLSLFSSPFGFVFLLVSSVVLYANRTAHRFYSEQEMIDIVRIKCETVSWNISIWIGVQLMCSESCSLRWHLAASLVLQDEKNQCVSSRFLLCFIFVFSVIFLQHERLSTFTCVSHCIPRDNYCWSSLFSLILHERRSMLLFSAAL